MTKDELEALAASLDRCVEAGEACGFEDSVTRAAYVVRAYGRLEAQFESMAEIAERAMAVARLARP